MPKNSLFKEVPWEDCVDVKDVKNILGKGFSESTIKRWIYEGKLLQGKHFYRMPGKTGRIKVSITMLKKFIEEENS
ncbi:hypothetical protein WA1_24045 [Scytonema hofmannii PCC 7110]|uniref:Uncharacterized protein n=2 Tax=Scytonema hofmannii TaxID=34078 RepID=A0A139X7R0_9CYAN|nr:hypothetical protein WA1_24045 [Scytonema hofmannii PCC 7110]